MANYYLVDAKIKPLGRIATVIAQLLRGKNSPDFKPNINPGNIVIVINAKDVNLTGGKKFSKQYFKHSGFPGGIKVKNFATLKKESAVNVIRNTVRGMLPKNRMRDKIIKNLKIFETDQHTYEKEKVIIEE